MLFTPMLARIMTRETVSANSFLGATAGTGAGGGSSADPEGDAADAIGAKGLLESPEDVVPPITDDFGQPDVVVHADEEGAVFEQARGACVGDDLRVHQGLPDFEDLGLLAALVESEFGQDLGENLGRGAEAGLERVFQIGEIHASPLGQGRLPWCSGRWAQGGLGANRAHDGATATAGFRRVWQGRDVRPAPARRGAAGRSCRPAWCR